MPCECAYSDRSSLFAESCGAGFSAAHGSRCSYPDCAYDKQCRQDKGAALCKHVGPGCCCCYSPSHFCCLLVVRRPRGRPPTRTRMQGRRSSIAMNTECPTSTRLPRKPGFTPWGTARRRTVWRSSSRTTCGEWGKPAPRSGRASSWVTCSPGFGGTTR